ncbi:TPA: minichromosome maintenance protein MCM, partial [Candidatus Woesearchaeota archaeon]|nr:minichromosome maintenance protein MCM [Candidatus Woesearchaeota archaeon]
ETGKIDIDRISTGITASQRNKIVVVKEIINELEKTKGKTVAIEDIIKEGELKGQSPESTEEVLEKLKRSGDIFEPKRGFITRI